jgi:hypothetical protein
MSFIVRFHRSNPLHSWEGSLKRSILGQEARVLTITSDQRACLDDKQKEEKHPRFFTMRFRVFHAASTVCLVFAMACMFERPAYAYIDPGQGILACQAISAFFAGVLFYFRRSLHNLLRLRMPGAASKRPFRTGEAGH